MMRKGCPAAVRFEPILTMKGIFLTFPNFELTLAEAHGQTVRFPSFPIGHDLGTGPGLAPKQFRS